MKKEMKETPQAFMTVLMNTSLCEENIKAITELFLGKTEMMDCFVKHIKENPRSKESELLKKAMEISEGK